MGPSKLVAARLVVLALGAVGARAGCPTAGRVGSFPSLPAFASVSDVLEPGPVLSEASAARRGGAVLRYLGPQPAGATVQSGCPFEQAGLVDWHAASTWPGGAVPAADGRDVVLPENAKVLVSHCSLSGNGTYGIITVPASSQLVFNDHEGVLLRCRGLLVRGKLLLGSPTCRLRSSVGVMLDAERVANPASLPFEYKGISVVDEGELAAFGHQYWPSWTRLAQSAHAGATRLVLQRPVNWRAGQELVVTGTEVKDSRDWHRNEVARIKSVRSDGRVSVVELAAPLAFAHHGGAEYQAEVALLTRSIVVQGDPSSEPTDVAPVACADGNFASYPCERSSLTGFGGHMVASGARSFLRVSGVQAWRMGQTNVLGRYPFHTHMGGEQAGERVFFRDSSVQRSFFRCFTLHGSSGVLVENNVAYDAIGHCYYLEDGIEERNELRHNLAAHVHFLGYPLKTEGQFMPDFVGNASMIQPADATASGFYISNAFNRVVGCAASGGYSGFAFPRFDRFIGDSRAVQRPGRWPMHRPTLEFDGNSCHSSGYWWASAGCIYVGGRLRERAGDFALVYNGGRDGPARETLCDDGSECFYRFTNVKTFLANWGINHWGVRSEMSAVEFANTQRPLGILGKHLVDGALIDCRAPGHQPEAPTSALGARNTQQDLRYFATSYVGIEFYDTHQFHIFTNVTFANCGSKERGSPIWRALTHSDRFVPEAMQASSRITYENCSRDMIYGVTQPQMNALSRKLSSWEDFDGSAFGKNKHALIGNAFRSDWWQLDNNCLVTSLQLGAQERDGFYSCDAVGPLTGNKRGIASFFMVHDDGSDERQVSAETVCSNGNRAVPCPAIGSVSHLGTSKSVDLTANGVVSGPSDGLGWLVRLDRGSPRAVNLTRIQLFQQQRLVVVLPYPPGTTFEISYRGAPWCTGKCEERFTAAGSAADVYASPGNKYFFDSALGLLFFRVVAQDERGLDFSGATGPGSGPALADQRAFSRQGARIAYTAWNNRIELRAACAPEPDNANYCAAPPLALPQNVCAYVGRPGALYGFDECYDATVDRACGAVVAGRTSCAKSPECCERAGLTCFAANATFAACRPDCPHTLYPDVRGQMWSCATVRSGTPVPTPVGVTPVPTPVGVTPVPTPAGATPTPAPTPPGSPSLPDQQPSPSPQSPSWLLPAGGGVAGVLMLAAGIALATVRLRRRRSAVNRTADFEAAAWQPPAATALDSSPAWRAK